MPIYKDTEGTTTMNINWKPIHTQMVMDKVSGLTVDMIAQKHGYTYGSVANILRNRRAIIILKQVEQEVLNGGISSLPDRIKQMKIMAFKHVETFLKDDNKYAEKSPFNFFDKAIKAIEVLDKVGDPSKAIPLGGTNQNIQLNIFNNAEQMSTLTSGLDRALEVAKNYENLLPETFDESSTDFERERSRRKDSNRIREREDTPLKKQG